MQKYFVVLIAEELFFVALEVINKQKFIEIFNKKKELIFKDDWEIDFENGEKEGMCTEIIRNTCIKYFTSKLEDEDVVDDEWIYNQTMLKTLQSMKNCIVFDEIENFKTSPFKLIVVFKGDINDADYIEQTTIKAFDTQEEIDKFLQEIEEAFAFCVKYKFNGASCWNDFNERKEGFDEEKADEYADYLEEFVPSDQDGEVHTLIDYHVYQIKKKLR